MLPVAIAATALALPAQWAEAGDAGDLPSTAQVIPYVAPGTLPSISGLLSGSDADMYLLEIVDPATFVATTVGGATIDTMLYLYSLDGRGVTFNDDASQTTQSRITGVNVPHAGLYYLAISRWPKRPTAAGGLMWPVDNAGEFPPVGPRGTEVTDGWTGNPAGSGSYTITLTGCRRPQKEIVAPDFVHLTGGPDQVGNSSSSANWWRTNGGRFQVVLEASHFQSAGFAGGYIDQIMFRGESGEPNRGGQIVGVQLRIGQTTATAATMTTDFAANLAAANNVLTTTLNSVVIGPSSGATPNNYNISLPLTFIGGYYLPSGANLLVDVTTQSATVPAVSGSIMPIDVVAAGQGSVRAAGINAALGAATGTKTSMVPAMGFKVDALGVLPPPTVPARNVSFGAGCGGSPSTFYETFVDGQMFDLVGLTLTPDNALSPSFYNVTSGPLSVDATVVNTTPNSTSDDASVPHALGFTFVYPGGVSTSIQACTNGYVWLDGVTTTADIFPSPASFLAGGPRLAAWWRDIHCGRNTVTHPNSGLHIRTVGTAPNRVCYVTWLNVGLYPTVFGTSVGGHAVLNMQVALFERTNVIQLRYGRMPFASSSETGLSLAGFTRGVIGGTPSVDPRSRDLSLETPFATEVEGSSGNMAQLVKATPVVGGAQYGGRAFAGQTLTFDAVGVPAGAVIGAQLLDIVASAPGLQIPTITAPGCVLSTGLNSTLFEARLFPPSTVVGTTPLVIPAGVEGFKLTAQYVVLDGLLAGGGPDIVTAASNAVRITVGKR